MMSFNSLKYCSRKLHITKYAIRTFLSNSYQCEKEWESRKRADIFQKIDYDDLYHQLDRSFQIGHRISGLDVDLFASGIDTDIYQNELEDVLFKLRLNPEAALLRNRTQHAVIRYYMSINKRKELLNILNNRLNYGVFPDAYASNLLFDSFLKENDSTSAAKVAVLSMLQEDLSHPILHSFSVYSCLKYLNSSDIWSPPKEAEVDEDEDETKIRVTFLRNPYFDDHFDIVDTNHLIGKTLNMSGSVSSGPLSLSSKVIGLALYEKNALLARLVSEIMTNKIPVHREAIAKALEYTKNKPKQAEEASSGNTKAIEADKMDLVNLLEKASGVDFLMTGDLENLCLAQLESAVSLHEADDIKKIKQMYLDWEREREEDIQTEIYESNKRKTVQEISKVKESLVNEEERIFFFDNEEEWNLKVEEKQAEIEKLKAEQLTTKKKKQTEEEYIPPEVGQKRL